MNIVYLESLRLVAVTRGQRFHKDWGTLCILLNIRFSKSTIKIIYQL